MWLIPVFAGLLLLLAIIERVMHQKNINKIPIRVNINGVRGKSTVTRLVTGIVKEAGYRTVGKTTGTSARFIPWTTRVETPIVRDPEGPNIKEQKKVVAKVAKMDAEALISECMAVNPDYQIVFQDVLLQANVGVIVNVLEDHMDVLGPTLDDVAQSFVSTIPHNGHLIINDSKYVDFYKQEAAKRNTNVIIADTSRISEAYMREFPYVIFPENAALGLAVAEALGIDEETARAGMLNAQPDPGALRVAPIEGNSDATSPFVNAFAANDAHSTLAIWSRVQELGYNGDHPIVIMNCRPDRVDRTEQFARDVLPKMAIGTLVLIGETVDPIVNAYKKGEINADRLVDLEGRETKEMVTELKTLINGDVMFGVGNIHGAAEGILELIEQEQDVSIA